MGANMCKKNAEPTTETTPPNANPLKTKQNKKTCSVKLSVHGNLKDYYTLKKKIGSGSYGEVFKAEHNETKRVVAIKRIRKERVRRAEVLKREMQFLLSVNHPHIVNVVDIIEDNAYLSIVQEFCSGNELFDRIIDAKRGLSEKDTARIIYQTLAGIQHCHDEVGIVHRDLKPENILFKTPDADSDVVIIDFGLSETIRTKLHSDPRIPHDHLKTKVGTPYYIAPEVFSRNYDRSCDLWSVGIITFILLCGYPPYNGPDENAIMNAVKEAKPVHFETKYWARTSDAAQNFIRSLLQKDPTKRPTAAEAMKDPWFQFQHTAELSIAMQIGPRLEIFHSMNKLKKMAAVVIAEEGTVEDVEELKRIFDRIDVHKTGTITKDELEQVLNDGKLQGGVDFEVLFRELDQDGAEMINYHEFIAAAIRPAVRQSDNNIKIAFDFFDKDKSGHITLENMIEIVGSEDQAHLLIGEADYKNDNRISYSEFHRMMTKPDYKVLLSDKHVSDRRVKAIALEWEESSDSSKEVKRLTLQSQTTPDVGMSWSMHNKTVVITNVKHGGREDLAGMYPLQILLEIDGKLTTGMTKSNIQKALSKNSEIVVEVGVLPDNTDVKALSSEASISHLKFSTVDK